MALWKHPSNSLQTLTRSHVPLVSKAAHTSLVLYFEKNRNNVIMIPHFPGHVLIVGALSKLLLC